MLDTPMMDEPITESQLRRSPRKLITSKQDQSGMINTYDYNNI